MNRIRITMGEFKGRWVKTRKDAPYRPVPARLREALFNRIGGGMRGVGFLDVYAGSGIMGIYALSLGCAVAAFLEQDPTVVRELRRRLAELGVSERAVIHRGDVLKVTRNPASRAYAWAFLGPPFAVTNRTCRRLMRNLAAQGWLTPGAVVILQRHVKSGFAAEAEWEVAAPPLTHGENTLLFYRKKSG